MHRSSNIILTVSQRSWVRKYVDFSSLLFSSWSVEHPFNEWIPRQSFELVQKFLTRMRCSHIITLTSFFEAYIKNNFEDFSHIFYSLSPSQRVSLYQPGFHVWISIWTSANVVEFICLHVGLTHSVDTEPCFSKARWHLTPLVSLVPETKHKI